VSAVWPNFDVKLVLFQSALSNLLVSSINPTTGEMPAIHRCVICYLQLMFSFRRKMGRPVSRKTKQTAERLAAFIRQRQIISWPMLLCAEQMKKIIHAVCYERNGEAAGPLITKWRINFTTNRWYLEVLEPGKYENFSFAR
jgi:hypothetical protein